MLALIAIAVALAAPNVQAAVVAVFGQVITAINSLYSSFRKADRASNTQSVKVSYELGESRSHR